MCKHITLVLPNRPGQFFNVSEILANEGINILGFALHSEGRAGFLNLLCSSHDRAFRTLELAYKQFCVEREVLVIKTPHHVGILKEILNLLRNADINLPTSYTALTNEEDYVLVLEIRNAHDRTKAKGLLMAAGHDVLASV